MGDWFLISAILVGIGTAVGVALWMTIRRFHNPSTPSAAEVDLSESPPELDQTPMPGAERRRTPRRKGWPTRVRLIAEGSEADLRKAYVVDRSVGGLRVAIQNRIPAGSRIRLRAENAPKGIPWVTLVVRHGRRVGDYYEIGCRFEDQSAHTDADQFG